MKIRSVGYLGINATDVEAWRGFAAEILGAQLRDDSAPGTLRLKVDDYLWRIAVHQAEAPGLAYIGLELANAQDFRDAVEELERAGVEVRLGADEELKARAVGGLAIFNDPAGNPLEGC